VLKFQGWQMVYKVHNILDTTQQNRDSKILTFQGMFFYPCLYRHGKHKICGLQMRWSDYYLLTETGMNYYGLYTYVLLFKKIYSYGAWTKQLEV